MIQRLAAHSLPIGVDSEEEMVNDQSPVEVYILYMLSSKIENTEVILWAKLIFFRVDLNAIKINL